MTSEVAILPPAPEVSSSPAPNTQAVSQCGVQIFFEELLVVNFCPFPAPNMQDVSFSPSVPQHGVQKRFQE